MFSAIITFFLKKHIPFGLLCSTVYMGDVLYYILLDLYYGIKFY